MIDLETQSSKQIISGVSAKITMDSFRAAVVDGNAYSASYADETGIVGGVSYFYWAVNTSPTKNIWLRPIYYNPGTFSLKFIKNGIFKLGGTVYTPSENSALALIGRNLNTNFPDKAPSFQLYFQSSVVLGAAVTWEEDTLTQIQKTVSASLGQPSNSPEAFTIIKPGERFMGIFKNYGTVKSPYMIETTWSEI